jgi:RNA polymerase sigma factor (sigma-70 family)
VTSLDQVTEQLLRDLVPDVLGAIVRRHGDFVAAEDAVQEALLVAAAKWPGEGVPDDPRAWLIRVADRRMIDHLRAELARRRRESAIIHHWPNMEALAGPPDEALDRNQDDTLRLLFMCCHPALTRTSAVAITLRAVGGLTTAEIARAYLVPETTMAQRISRAKQLIRKSGVGFDMPEEDERQERLQAVLHVLYLVFNEGYATSSGRSLHRVDLSREAIRLTRALHGLLPDDGEVAGLLALMLLTDGRRAARSGLDGELIPLDEQDRSLWDRSAIDEGTLLITRTLARGAVGIYQLQAAIAAVHDEAPSGVETDWTQILGLYGLLRRITDNPMVALSHAVAVAMVHGPAQGLEALELLDADQPMARHHRLAAVRARRT